MGLGLEDDRWGYDRARGRAGLVAGGMTVVVHDIVVTPMA
jgi:hypothetical protein